MGNKNSCCVYSSPQVGRKEVGPESTTRNLEEHLPEGGISVNNLQHISEREPEDCDSDPSLHPCAGTIFMERSKQAIENGMVRKKSQHQIADTRPLKKSSSCSTIYLDDSTVSQPNLKNTVKCVALAVYYHIKNRTSQRQIDIFDEKLHPLTADIFMCCMTNFLNKLLGHKKDLRTSLFYNQTTNQQRDGVSEDYDKHNPEHKQIYKFIRTLFNAAQLTAECAIITLVYLERLLTYAEIDITPANWKRIVLGAILLASKVWDDQAVWNVDYCQILKDITVEDMNELERQFLEMLQFNINVPSSVYAKYYFDLRTLAEANELTFPSEPLSKEKAQKLEAMSRVYEDKVTAEALRTGIKKWSSLDNVCIGGPRRSIAILS